jgi:hypothetical protein
VSWEPEIDTDGFDIFFARDVYEKLDLSFQGKTH